MRQEQNPPWRLLSAPLVRFSCYASAQVMQRIFHGSYHWCVSASSSIMQQRRQQLLLAACMMFAGANPPSNPGPRCIQHEQPP